jgi:hypothetical protein
MLINGKTFASYKYIIIIYYYFLIYNKLINVKYLVICVKLFYYIYTCNLLILYYYFK